MHVMHRWSGLAGAELVWCWCSVDDLGPLDSDDEMLLGLDDAYE
jgi:hypothetical protein